jgi:type III pantothenate kinase
MLLAVDIGNTSIKFGVFDGEVLKHRSSVPTNSSSLGDAVAASGNVSSAIVCSVVPHATNEVIEAIKERLGVSARIVVNTDDLGLTIKHQPIESIGTDRLVNAFAAATRYGTPVVVCSLGTATTIDAVSENHELLGGLIAPGIRTASKALHVATARLPEVEPAAAEDVINATTEDAIRAGLYYTQVGLIEAAVSRIRHVLGPDAKVVATGGFARMIAEYCKAIDVVDDDLVLDGLQMLDALSR